MPCAVRLRTTVAVPPDGAGVASPEGAGEAAPEGAGARVAGAADGDPALPAPAAPSRGRDDAAGDQERPDEEHREDDQGAGREARRRDVLEVAGGVGLHDLAVLLAGVVEPAQEADDGHQDAGEEDDGCDDQPEEQRRGRDRRQQRPERWPRDVDPLGRAPGADGRQGRRRLEGVVLAVRLAAPVEERPDHRQQPDREGRDAQRLDGRPSSCQGAAPGLTVMKSVERTKAEGAARRQERRQARAGHVDPLRHRGRREGPRHGGSRGRVAPDQPGEVGPHHQEHQDREEQDQPSPVRARPASRRSRGAYPSRESWDPAGLATTARRRAASPRSGRTTSGPSRRPARGATSPRPDHGSAARRRRRSR